MFDNLLCKILHDAAFFVQAMAALGQVLSALVGAVAAILAYRTIKQLERQNYIQLEGIGLPRLSFKLTFVESKPVHGRPILPDNVDQLNAKEAPYQLNEVLKRWLAKPFNRKLPNHEFIIIEVISNQQNNLNVSNIEILFTIICPSSPEPYQAIFLENRWQVYTIKKIESEFSDKMCLYLPLEGIPTCKVRIKGHFTFAGENRDIKEESDGFNDLSYIIGENNISENPSKVIIQK